MYQMNPMQIIAQIRQGKNPQQIMLSFLEGRAQENPVFANLYSLAKEGKTSEIEAFARNIAQERGLDFDKEFSRFKKEYFGL